MHRPHREGRARRRAVLLTVALALSGIAQAAASDGLLPPDGEAYFAQITGIVAKHGWACVFVADDKRKGGFAYSVGLTGKHVPELLIDNGEDEKTSCALLNEVAKRLIARRESVPDGYEPFGRRALRLHRIYSAEFLDKCVLAGVWVLRHKAMRQFTGMQIVFPDEHGRFPD